MAEIHQRDWTVSVTSAIDFTRDIVANYSDRLTGSKMCMDSAHAIEQELTTFCDDVHHQEFDVRPASFLGFIKVCIILYLGVVALLLLQMWYAAALLSIVSGIILVFQFGFYKELIDPLFSKKTARNVWGVIQPIGDAKQQIYITAHHDSAHVCNFLQHQPKYYNLKVNTSLGSNFLVLLFAIINAIFFALSGNAILPQNWLIGLVIIATPFALITWRYYDPKRGTPGAGDNMICVAAAMEIGKYFSKHKLEHTKVILGSWDAEEAGLRGARAYVKQYGGELRTLPTYNYNLECLYDVKQLNMLTSDLNGYVKLSETLADQCVDIGRVMGYQIESVAFPLLAGGTDAAEFAKAGAQATTLSGMRFGERPDDIAYHTLRDTIEAVDPLAVEAAIGVGVGLVLALDT